MEKKKWQNYVNIFCPKCHSEDLVEDWNNEPNEGSACNKKRCKDCDFEWNELYQFVISEPETS